MTTQERVALQSCLDKRIVGFSQLENKTNMARGEWHDDEPLHLRLDDGSVLSISALGFHDSGSLVLTVYEPKVSAHRCPNDHSPLNYQGKCPKCGYVRNGS